MALKKRTVVRAQSAEDDLYQLRLHLEDQSPDTVRSTILDLNRKIHDIAAKGITGSTRPWAPEHVRAFPYKAYCFYFTVDNGTLTLLRVRAHAQSIDDLDFQQNE